MKQIPVESLEVAKVKDDAVTFGNRPLINRISADHVKEFVTSPAGIRDPLQKRLPNPDLNVRRYHRASLERFHYSGKAA
jgi:hypothetical protein